MFSYTESMNKESIIAEFYRAHRRMPTVRELMPLFGYRTTSAVAKALTRLEESGRLTRGERGHYLPHPDWNGIPMLGLVEAGFPSPAEEDRGELADLSDYLIEERSSSYMLTVKGDSMRDAGILSGDKVIVERGRSARVGDIVIAEVDGSWTMKYLREKRGKHYLEAANPDYPDIIPSGTLHIAAVVRAVVRKY